MRKLLPVPMLAVLLSIASNGGATTVSDSRLVVKGTHQEAIQSQQKVDTLALETQKMLEEYQRIVRNTDYQDAYNAQLQQLKLSQEQEIASLSSQLDDINVTQMRIMPLLLSMADALEKFVLLDLPFQQEDRISAVVRLKQQLRNPSLAVPDKYRMVLEAFQVESDYGRTLASYRDTLTLEGDTRSVQFLRVGRIALYYQTLDGSTVGHWDGEQWQVLPDGMQGLVQRALRVADQQVAPQLLRLPLIKPAVVTEANPS